MEGRVAANIAAIEVVQATVRDERDPTDIERDVVRRWSGWGAAAVVFDETRDEWSQTRDRLRGWLGEDGYAASRLTTINAHYTHPAIAEAIWTVAEQLGFRGGHVLEPGCGAGVFMSVAPARAEMFGVELDPMTADIAAAANPDAHVKTQSFADFNPRRRDFDLVIGNVPFADVRLYDPHFNRGNHSLHNHFLIKGLALAKPGGDVVALTSRFTMDSSNPAARRELAELGELLGAVRLPAGAHRRAAGTEAVTDLLIFRKHPVDQGGHDEPEWVRTRETAVDGGNARINEYFLEHPGHVLGDTSVGPGMYGAQTVTVRGDYDPERVAERIRAIGSDIAASAPPVTVDHSVSVPAAERVVEAPEGLWDGHLIVTAPGRFAVVRDGLQEPLDVPRTAGGELQHLLHLRDQARRVLSIEAESLTDTPALDTARQALRDSYTEYHRRYRAINRFTLRPTGRISPVTGEQQMAQITPTARRILRGDPFCALVCSLETFDDTTQHAEPAGLLAQRMVVPREPVRGVETPGEAVAVCMDTNGHLDLAEIARLRGLTEPDARTELGELVYDDVDGRLRPAAEYLSGNVRDKLTTARAAVVDQPGLAVNVAALENVLPTDLGAGDIEPRLGAVWIPVADHQTFLQDLLEDPGLRVESPGGGVWAVRGRRTTVMAMNRWGTGRVPAPKLAQLVMEQKPIKVMDELDDGSRVLNPEETAAALEKAHAIQEQFGEWLWEDPDRSRRLVAEYNRRFNSIVLRDYQSAGRELQLPRLAQTFTPREHQRAAVARMLAEPTVGLFHDVGAGKTAEMIIGATELRRLGLIRKPVIVVPNHMLDQFAREWLQLYPQARVLAAGSQDISGDKRKLFVARAALNDWDGVIMTRSAFERIPVSHQAEVSYKEERLAESRAMALRAKNAGGLTVKQTEKRVMRHEEQLKKLLDTPRDNTVTFEQTGFDYVIVDEAHGYKNLQTESNIPDGAIDGSKRATDLHLKMELLRSREGDRIGTFATATPIANSVTEAHVMQRYLRPDLLSAAGVEDFDQWAATFGQTVTEMEMAPAGAGSYRLKTRFARFQNVPEMLRLWHVFADVKTAEDLRLPTPDLAERDDGGRGPRTVVIDPSPQLQEYVTQLGERAESVRAGRVPPEEDNMLLISMDGRKAALDLRLATGHAGEGRAKLDIAAHHIAGIYQANRANAYIDVDTGQPSSVAGGLQIVFCDLGTPKLDAWNAYDELRDRLADHGVPAHQVRFVHEAKNDREKQALFHAARAGHIAVLVGSTEKLGVGTNIQARAVALHHLDCPWRPADIEQRDGRIIRQGNQNPEVQIVRYVVERSFDAYSWQTVERKARFIAQVTRGRLDVREIEDLGDSTLSFAEVKALASGDPLVLDLANSQNELARLQRLQRSWDRGKTMLTDTVKTSTQLAAARERQIGQVTTAIAARTDTTGDRFAMTIDGQLVDSRTDAGQLLATWARSVPPNTPRPVGQLGGLNITGTVAVDRYDGARTVTFELADVPAEKAVRSMVELVAQPLGMIRQLEHRLASLPDLQARLEHDRQAALHEAERARDTLRRPFKHADALKTAAGEVKAITTAMHEAQAARDQHAANSTPAAGEPTVTTPSVETASDERLVRVLGEKRARQINDAIPLLRERFTVTPGSDHAPSVWRDPEAQQCHNRIVAIANAARREPAERNNLKSSSDHEVQRIADQALAAARTVYKADDPTTPGSANRVAQRDRPHQAPSRLDTASHRPGIDR